MFSLMRTTSLGWCSATAFAQTPAGMECKQEVNATGQASLTLDGAKQNAIKNWQRSVVLRYGEIFSKFDQAAPGKTADLCGKTVLGLNRCEAKGRPCAPSGASNPTPGPVVIGPGRERDFGNCDTTDSADCAPVVKWVQRHLNRKIDAGLKVDGAAGTNTQKAIRRFKSLRGLPNSNDATINDESFLAALES